MGVGSRKKKSKQSELQSKMYPAEIHHVFLCQTYARVEIKKKPADISLVMCGRVCCSPDKQSLDSVPPLRNVPSHPKGLSASV